MKIVPVIMAGGAGTRLWPLSRDDRPKQFHNLSGKGTLLEETVRRLMPLNADELIVVTSLRYEALTREETAKFDLSGAVLCEPRPRNTAAAILYAAIYLARKYGDSVMIVLPADHYIRDNAAFLRILKIAIDCAISGKLVTIGIKPSYPETGYGYIKAKPGLGEILDIDRFVEKPDAARAKEYLSTGDYFWNSGIFIWKSSVILGEFNRLMPALVGSFSALAALPPDRLESNCGDVWEMKKKAFDSVEPVSIDYGILEHARDAVVIPAEFGWADLGSWKSIDDILEPDENGNRSPSRDRAVFIDSRNCSVYSESRRIAVVGLSDAVVAEAGNDILVIQKDSSQEVKKVVDLLGGK